MKKLLIVSLALLMLISFVICQIYLLSQNTLANNNNWYSIKRHVGMGLLGADTYYYTKVALRKSQLNLGAWHGFQGVIYKEKVDPEEVEFDFLLSENSYVYFIFNRDAERYKAVRLSVNDAFRNVIVTVSDAGEFLEKTELQVDSIKENEWNHLKMVFEKDRYTLFVNEKLIGSYHDVLLQKQYIGFSGSYNHAFVDNIQVIQKDSDEIIKESFSNIKNRNKIFIQIFGAVLILNIIVVLFMMFRKKEWKKIAFTSILLNILVLIMSISLLFVYYYKNELKLHYPKIHGIYKDLMKTERVYRNYDLNFVNNQILNEYGSEVSGDVNRIMFVGSSQTRGVGARNRDEVFVRVVERILNQRGGGRFECINAGVHGINSKGLLGYYKKNWSKLHPKTTLINLSNNDNDRAVFRSSLQQFVDINKAEGIRTVFILEANSIEPGSDLNDFHNIMREVGDKNGVYIIDLHNYLVKKYDDGLLWWDGVHMTSYAQRLTAEFISDELMSIQ